MVNPEQLWQLSCLLYRVMLASFQGDGGAAVWPRKVLVIDEAHRLEAAPIDLGRRSIHPKTVAAIGGRLYEFPGKRDKELLDNAAAQAWLEYFADAITHAIGRLNDKILMAGAARTGLLEDKKRLENLREGIHFTLQCGDWIAWLTTNPRLQRILHITPMSAVRAANITNYSTASITCSSCRRQSAMPSFS